MSTLNLLGRAVVLIDHVGTRTPRVSDALVIGVNPFTQHPEELPEIIALTIDPDKPTQLLGTGRWHEAMRRLAQIPFIDLDDLASGDAKAPTLGYVFTHEDALDVLAHLYKNEEPLISDNSPLARKPGVLGGIRPDLADQFKRAIPAAGLATADNPGASGKPSPMPAELAAISAVQAGEPELAAGTQVYIKDSLRNRALTVQSSEIHSGQRFYRLDEIPGAMLRREALLTAGEAFSPGDVAPVASSSQEPPTDPTLGSASTASQTEPSTYSTSTACGAVID